METVLETLPIVQLLLFNLGKRYDLLLHLFNIFLAFIATFVNN